MLHPAGHPDLLADHIEITVDALASSAVSDPVRSLGVDLGDRSLGWSPRMTSRSQRGAEPR